jgi:spore germination protein
LTNLSDPDQLRMAEKVLSLYLQKEMKNFITLLQRLKVDPVGFGDRVRGKSAHWNYEHFKEIYPRMDIAVKAHVTLEHSGLGE